MTAVEKEVASEGVADQALIDSVSAFLYQEAKYLDALDYNSWLALFTEDARYWIPLKRNPKNPALELNHAYDDLGMLRLRADRLTAPDGWGQQPPPATARIIGNISVSLNGDGSVNVESTFICWQWYRDNVDTMGGQLTHTLVREGDSWRIQYKKVTLPAPEIIKGSAGIMY